MTIASAITALNPSIWFPLNGGAAGTILNQGTSSNNGTLSGSFDFNTIGPEPGTVGLRLYVTGQLITGVMDLTGFVPQTLGFWAQCLGGGVINQSYPILGIGDPANRSTRGPCIFENHAAAQQPRYSARYAVATSGNATPQDPKNGWHWVVAVYTAGTNGCSIYIDGFAAVQGNQSGTNQLATDPLLLRCDEEIVVSNVCWWGSALSAAQIASVANEKALWPSGEPINRAPTSGGGGGGGLTPDQATQLSEIDTKTDDIPGLVTASEYISDTVNVINGFVQDTNTRVQDLQAQMADAQGKLDTLLASVGASLEAQVADISSFVQRVFQTGAGIALSTPIGSMLSHPDPNLLQASSSTFVISGRGTCPSPGVLSFGNVFGVQWEATTIPIRAGYRSGVIDEYNQRLVQFVRYFIEPHTGILYAGDIADFDFQNYTWFWDRPFPHQIDYDVLPGFELTCRWVFFTP